MTSSAAAPRRRLTITDVQIAAERIRLDRAVLATSRRWPTRTRPFAEPPPDGTLRPVMGDHGPPVIGRTLEVLFDFLNESRARYRRFGPVSWGAGPIGPTVSAVGPEASEQVLTNRNRDFANGPGWSPLIGPFFRRGIMLLDFDEHLAHRRIMQGAFTRPRLESYLAAMQPGLDRGVGAWGPGEGFPVLPHLKRLLLDNASDVFLGGHADIASGQALVTAFVDTVRAGSAIVRADVLPGSRWWKGMRGREVLEAHFRSQLPAAKADPDRGDLFAALVHQRDEHGARFSDEDVVNHMIFLLMAAHDTSTITLTTMMWALARHPEWQEAARQESDAVGRDALTWDDLDRFPTIDLVQREALRYIAPVHVLMRAAVRDTEILGRYVPEGTLVMLSPFVTHRLPDLWRDPDRFDPTRFEPGGEADRLPRHAWIPFGGGVHKCIGLHFAGVQIKALLHQILRRFRWSLPDDHELRLDTTTLPAPRDGLPVRLRRRAA